MEAGYRTKLHDQATKGEMVIAPFQFAVPADRVRAERLLDGIDVRRYDAARSALDHRKTKETRSMVQAPKFIVIKPSALHAKRCAVVIRKGMVGVIDPVGAKPGSIKGNRSCRALQIKDRFAWSADRIVLP